MYYRYLFFIILTQTFFSCKENKEADADEPLMVYITAKDGYLYAVDAATGSQNWKCYTGSSRNYSSVALDEGTVYVSGTYDKLYAIDAFSGKVRWTTAEGTYFTGTPFVYNKTVYATDLSGAWWAFNTLDGQLKWKLDKKLHSLISATAADGLVYLGGGLEGGLFALDAETGEERWFFKASLNSSGPALAGNLLIAGTLDQGLLALDSKTGTKKWSFTSGKRIVSSPAIENGVAFFGGEDGKMYAVNISDGTKKWEFTTSELITSSPFVSNGRIYFGGIDTKVYALDVGTGKKVWEYATERSIESSPVEAGGVLFVGDGTFGRDRLHALHAADGTLKWTFEANDYIFHSPAVLMKSGKVVHSGLSGARH